MRFIHRPYAAPIMITFAVAVLYGGFLSNPLLFDDIVFFGSGGPEKFLSAMGLQPRHFALSTLVVGQKLFGVGLIGLRLGSLLLHAGVAICLYYFLCQIQQVLTNTNADSTSPVAVYGAAYLIQRTIVMGTLFALLCWWCWLRGLQTKQNHWLWCSVGVYAFAVWCKEHTVMVPAVSVALTIWWWRTQIKGEGAGQLLARLLPMTIGYFVVAVLVVLQKKEILGSTYELDAPEMLGAVSLENAWFLSVITQGMLFFKYLALWILPNPMWMSVDMREPFARSFTALPQLLGFLAFVLWPLLAVCLLWKGGRRGLLGFGMLAPWLLFATELSAVRIQESFVLYRSYLWLAPSFCLVLLLAPWLTARKLIALTILMPLYLFPLALNRLTTFSHPLLLWDDAERLVEGRQDLTGLERIYTNRGNQLYEIKKYQMAIDDYSKAINFNVNYAYAYNNRGILFLELGRFKEALYDFEHSLQRIPNNARSIEGRGTALVGLGRTEEAKQSFRAACALGWQSACTKANP
jgi:protein O-mannosyl-transferase